MSDGSQGTPAVDLRWIASATAVVIAVVAAAAVAYLLLDILLVLFLGIVIAAALQPWHLLLCRRGMPRGVAVLLIYVLLLVGLLATGLVIGPVLIEQVRLFAAEFPKTYAGFRSWLVASGIDPLQYLGMRVPTFERIAPALSALAPQVYQGTVGVTTGIMMLPVYFVTVLAIGFYWTMELPRFERLLLSLIAVERRPRALNAWHEIESRLGGFVRGQALAMLFVAVASTVCYAQIGLPHVLALGLLAGLLEAVPWIGPLLAVGPALLIAAPMGAEKTMLVVALALVLQVVENNILIPRIMRRAVGVSALVSLLAILAFGTLYGVLGVLIAIPMAAVIQVLLDSLVVNVEEVAAPAGMAESPWLDLRTRVLSIRQRARVRLRSRSSRMGIDPAISDHVVDALDQQMEVAAARVVNVIAAVEKSARRLGPDAQAAIVEKLLRATLQLEGAVDPVDGVVSPEDDVIPDELGNAARRFEEEVGEAEALVVAATTTEQSSEA